MPAYVLKNDKPKVGLWVVELEEHQLDGFLAQYKDSGWSLDKKTDPADVPPQIAPAEPVNHPKGN